MKSIIRFILTCVLFVVFSTVALRSELVQGPTITSNFEEDAPHFHVLGFKNGDYEILTLSQAINSNDQFRFDLRDTEHRIELGARYRCLEPMHFSWGVVKRWSMLTTTQQSAWVSP